MVRARDALVVQADNVIGKTQEVVQTGRAQEGRFFSPFLFGATDKFSARSSLLDLYLPLLQPRERHHRKDRQERRRRQPILQNLWTEVPDFDQLPLSRRRCLLRLD